MSERHGTTPRIAGWILSRLKFYDDQFAIRDAIEEECEEIRKKEGRIRSWIWIWYHTLEIACQYIFWKFQWSGIMIKNYLKITFRTLKKNKAFSIINICGLALSMSICLMIMIFIKDQKSSDGFHEKKDRIVRIYTTDNAIEHPEVKGWATTPGFLAPYLSDNIPFVEDAVRVRMMGANVLKTKTAITIGGFYADPSFFNIFSFPLRDGNAKSALVEPFSIVLSEETAYKFFGHANPVDQMLTLESLGDFKVTGILRDVSQKSHFSRFDALISFSTIHSLENKQAIRSPVNAWSSMSRYYTYVLLENINDRSALERQLPEISNTLVPEQHRERYEFKLQPLSRINLGLNLANGMPGTQHSFEYVFIPFLAMLVIFLSCFNYIILSIARSLKRTKEIGLRKVVGSRRGQVIRLFLSETFTITILALIASCLLILWLIPAFNRIDAIETARMQINLEQMKDPSLYLIFIAFAFGVSFLAGIYPALYLSSFQPVSALQGVSRIKGFSRLLMRKVLMGIQFTVSLVSIIFIVYFYQLNTYWTRFDTGIAMDNIVNVTLRDVNVETFRNEVKKGSHCAGVSFSSAVPVYGAHHRPGVRRDKTIERRPAYYYSIDPDFIPNLHLELIAGRNFSDDFSTDTEEAVIINEKAVHALDFGSPAEAVGQSIILGEQTEVTVIGVIKDFNYRLLENPIEPLALRYRPQEFRYANIMYTHDVKEDIETWLTGVWEKFDRIHPIQISFVGDLEERHRNQIGGTLKISMWACGFVIVIALFGLLGMAMYTSEMKVREIGIRKVLGASVSGVSLYLSKGYIKLILISAAFALPGGYYLSESMMQFFAFRPRLSLWVLPGTLAFILILAVMTISSQTVKAALANPVETLRTE